MTSGRTPSEFVVHVARLYHRGVVGPTEAWSQIEDAITELDAVALFDGLDVAEQSILRGMHLERPESLRELAKSKRDLQFPAMLDWCEIATGS